MKINVFEHGGQTRKILTIEIGRNHKRGENFVALPAVMAFIWNWLRTNI